MKKNLLIPIAFLALIPSIAKAHCPLCTAGAGALAVLAAYYGVNTIIIGIFIGAFALALSLWIPKLIKKKYISHQKEIIGTIIFITTIVPLMPLIQDYTSFNIFLVGDYGSLLNRTYMVNKFLLGSGIGATILFLSPTISRNIAKARKNQLFPYQGMIITFGLLIIASLLIQFVL